MRDFFEESLPDCLSRKPGFVIRAEERFLPAGEKSRGTAGVVWRLGAREKTGDCERERGEVGGLGVPENPWDPCCAVDQRKGKRFGSRSGRVGARAANPSCFERRRRRRQLTSLKFHICRRD